MTPEERESERLELLLYDNPEETKAVYAFVSNVLKTLVAEMYSIGLQKSSGEVVIEALVQTADYWKEASEL